MKETDRRRDLEVLLTLSFAFLVLNQFTQQDLTWVVIFLLGIAVFFKPIAHVLVSFWLSLAQALGILPAKILMALFFYLFLTPIAFLYRLFHRDPLKIKRKAGKESFFIRREHKLCAKDFEKLW